MVNKDIKKIVAEICSGYTPESILNLFSMAEMSPSCNNCKNFVDGECSKELFNKIKDTISMN